MRRTLFYSRLLSLLLALCLAHCFWAVPARADGITGAEGARDGMVRVYLSSLGQPGRVDVTICGSYSLDGTDATALPEGSKLSVSFNSATGQLTLTQNGVSRGMGTDFRLCRHDRQGSNGVKIAQARVSGNLYPGDLQFKTAKNGGVWRLYVIAHVFIEDYLYGVLPYEMGNSSALEALKAQCVSARTYTLRAMQNAGSRSYDLVDTTNDQVYNGTPSGNARCRQAVDETRGIVAMNNGAFTATYYTASNGGQIESVRNIWGYAGYDYIRVKDDPYDYQNPYAPVRSFKVAASGAQTATLNALLVSKAKSIFSADSVTISRVTAVTPHTPRYAAPSRLYTKLNFDVEAVCDGQTKRGTLTFDIFSELEKKLGMSINNDNNELWSVVATDTGFTVQARRFGHGTGLSQRGAMRMGDLGYTYDQILNFYFEGCQRVQFAFVRSVLSPLGSGLSREQLSVDTPAQDTGVNASAAIVRLYSPAAEMALRQSPSSSAALLCGIPYGAAVTVHGQTGDWMLVSYGKLTGYAQAEGLQLQGTPDGQAPAVTVPQGYGTVEGAGYLNLREGMALTTPALTQIPVGTALPLLRVEGDWAYTQYGCQAGYVSMDYIRRTAAYAGAAIDANATGAVLTASSPLYLSPGLGGYVYQTLPQGTQARVLYTDGAWSQIQVNGVTGYVLSSGLQMNGAAVPLAQDTPGPGEQYARVTAAASWLNLRERADMSSAVMAQIPLGEQVIVTETQQDWMRVRYHGVTGWCAAAYLSLGMMPGGSLTAVVVTESGPLNLRRADSAQAAILTTIPRGASVAVLARGDSWCCVTYNGQTGYAMTRYLQFNEASGTAAPSTAVPAATQAPALWQPAPVQSTVTYAKVTTDSGSLNLRKKASSSASIQARIPQDEMIEVLSRGEKWTQVAYKAKTGYVMTTFLTFVEVPQPVVPQAMTARVNTPKGSLNLRAKAQSGSKVLRTLPKDSTVIVLEYGEKWSKVTYGSATGYVKSQFLLFEKQTEASAQPQALRVKGQYATLRASPQTAAAAIRLIPAGDYVQVIGQTGGWMRVEYEGITGYVPEEDLERP